MSTHMRDFAGKFAIVCLLAGTADAATPVQTSALPQCEQAAAPDQPGGLRIGLVAPANPQLVAHLAALAQTNAGISLCRESWSRILPLATPFAKVARLEKYYGWGGFLFGLAVALMLAACLTPRHWWRRPTALGLAGILGATWLIGAASLAGVNWLGWPQRALYADILSLQHGREGMAWQEVDGVRGFERVFAPYLAQGVGKPARIATATGGTPGAPLTGNRQFHVRQTLNLREHAGIDGKRLGILNVGDVVTTTGLRHGDWWQIQVSLDGRQRSGWVSSLWLQLMATPTDG